MSKIAVMKQRVLSGAGRVALGAGWMTGAAAVALTSGCAADIRPEGADAGGGDGAGADGDSSAALQAVQVTALAGGISELRINATSETAWVYVDLDAMSGVAEGDASWDIACQRFRIKTNGGTGGKGNVSGAQVTGTAFAELQQAPATGYGVDEVDSADEGKDADTVFLKGGGWYTYDAVAHVLAPKPVVYVLKTTGAAHKKVAVVGYYDAAGTPGWLTIKVGTVVAPVEHNPEQFDVDVSVAGQWTYVRLGDRATAKPSKPEDSQEWDVAFKGSQVRTNSGSSGTGGAGAQAMLGSTWSQLTVVGTTGFVQDSLLAVAGPPGSGMASSNAVLGAWYNYDAVSHAVSPKDGVFAVRGAKGDLFKLKFVAYGSGKYTLGSAPLARQVATQALAIDAASKTAWTYVDLTLGQAVAIGDPATQTGWDVAVRRTEWRTNSGTSGGGKGGAILASTADLAGIQAAPADGYLVDNDLPLPGPPGSGTSSGNPVLGGWYNYDPVSHEVSPKVAAFIVRTRNGGYVKLRVTTYAAGAYGVKFAYAGHGQASFQ